MVWGLTFSVSANSKTYSGPTEFIEEFNEKYLTISMKDIDSNQEFKEVSDFTRRLF